MLPALAFGELGLQRLVAMTGFHLSLNGILTYTEMAIKVRWCTPVIVTFCRQRLEDCQFGN